MGMEKVCFACGRKLGKGPRYFADCADEQKNLPVGPDCYNKILEQSDHARNNNVKNPGYLPKSGGPALFPVGEAN
jgi:hypothetical protein